MKFEYRNRIITINDKIVKCFTDLIEPTITERLFDMYLRDIYGDGEKEMDDIDLSQYTNEELSKKIEDCMFNECKVYCRIGEYWEKEFEKK